MKYRFTLAFAVFVLVLIALGHFCNAQTCTITSPTQPAKVNGGGTQTFQFSGCGASPTCVVSGSGTVSLSGSSCIYTAPATAHPQNEARGVQEMPNNNAINVPVNSLPVVTGHLWMQRLQGFGGSPYFKLYPSFVQFFDNVCTAATCPAQLMHFYYPDNSQGYQDTNFPQPQAPAWIMQNGAHSNAFGGYDRHQITINPQTGQNTEVYNLYIDFRTSHFTAGNPTTITWTTNSQWTPPQGYNVYVDGAQGTNWAGIDNNGNPWLLTVISCSAGTCTGTIPFNSSGLGNPPAGLAAYSLGDGYECANCNSQSGQQFNPGSNAQQGGTNAAGTPVDAMSIKMEEWYRAVKQGKTDLGHAIGTTISNGAFAARNVWPATLFAYGVSGYQNLFSTCTNAAPAVCTTLSSIGTQQPCWNGSSWGFTTGCQFQQYIYGLTGSWAALNGFQTGTVIDDSHYSINGSNSTTYGAFPQGQSWYVPDFVPYGACARLVSTFDNTCVCNANTDQCNAEHIFLNTLKNYGACFVDGTVPSDALDSYITSSEFMPPALMDAADDIRNNGNSGGCLRNIYNNLQFVDRSGQQVYTSSQLWGVTNTNRTTVTVVGSGGTGNASQDVNLQGTAIGTDRERIAIVSGATFNLAPHIWVTGNTTTTFSCTLGSGIPGASVTSNCAVTMPACPTSFPALSAIVTATATADTNATTYIEVDCLPVNTDGSYRIALGNYNEGYTDTQGFKWYGSFQNYSFNNHESSLGSWWASQNGTWPGFNLCSGDTQWNQTTDQQIYNRSTDIVGDTVVDVGGLPNGAINVTVYGEPGFGGFGGGNTCGNTAGKNVFDIEAQGVVAQNNYNLDGFVLAGNQPYAGWSRTITPTVTNNLLTVIGRIRAFSTYGMSWGSVKIASAGPQGPQITTTSLPTGEVSVVYANGTINASGGTSPYTWSITVGSPPAGLALQTGCTGLSCAITGTPTQAGQGSFTVQICDHNNLCGTAPLTIQVQPLPVITTTSLPNGQVGQVPPYFAQLQLTGGVPPFTWTVLSGTLPPGITLVSTTGVLSGSPTAPGTFCATYQVTDSNNQSATSGNLCITITGGGSTLTIITTQLPPGTLGYPYSQQVRATGGTAPYTWTIIIGGLPSGLTLTSSTGVISGTPAAPATSPVFTIQCADSGTPQQIKTQTLSIALKAAVQNGVTLTGNQTWTGNISAK